MFTREQGFGGTRGARVTVVTGSLAALFLAAVLLAGGPAGAADEGSSGPAVTEAAPSVAVRLPDALDTARVLARLGALDSARLDNLLRRLGVDRSHPRALDCLCRQAPHGQVSVYYSREALTVSPACANPANGPCVQSGFRCARGPLPTGAEAIAECRVDEVVAAALAGLPMVAEMVAEARRHPAAAPAPSAADLANAPASPPTLAGSDPDEADDLGEIADAAEPLSAAPNSEGSAREPSAPIGEGDASFPATVEQVAKAPPAAGPAVDVPADGEPTFTGTWRTNWGIMELRQIGDRVEGGYEHAGGRIEGVIVGDTLIGKWAERPSYGEPTDKGDIEFSIAPDGSSFTGKWRYGSEGGWSPNWTGTRL